ncbi:MAG: hypothetical protein RLQ12_21880 [Cyclobacteriaceae bacterium]
MSDNFFIVSSPVSNSNTSGFLFYYLPESLIQIEHKVSLKLTIDEQAKKITQSNIVSQSFKTTEKVSADTTIGYSVSYISNPFHHDEIELKTNEQGLIESGTIATEDKTSTIVEQLFGSLKEVADATKIQAEMQAPGSQTKEVIQEYSQTFELSFQSLVQANGVKKPQQEVNKPGVSNPKVQDSSNLITQRSFNWEIKASHDDALNSEVVPISFALELKNAEDFPITQGAVPDAQTKIKGIITRLKTNAFLQYKNDEGKEIGAVVQLMVCDFSNPVHVPIKRAPFVKRTDTISFKEGFPISHKVIQPSSYSGFVSIPVTIAKAIVSIPAQLLSIKINTAKSQTELNNAIATLKSSELSVEKSLKEQELAIKKLEVDIKDKSIEMEKVVVSQEHSIKLELQKNEKALLQTEKEIQELKNEIIKLKK